MVLVRLGVLEEHFARKRFHLRFKIRRLDSSSILAFCNRFLRWDFHMQSILGSLVDNAEQLAIFDVVCERATVRHAQECVFAIELSSRRDFNLLGNILANLKVDVDAYIIVLL